MFHVHCDCDGVSFTKKHDGHRIQLQVAVQDWSMVIYFARYKIGSSWPARRAHLSLSAQPTVSIVHYSARRIRLTAEFGIELLLL
jgi:hypothetical protein